MIPTVIVPLIDNKELKHYEHLARRAVASIEAQTVLTPWFISKASTLSEAKNSGVERAGTATCMFLDADDILDYNFIHAVDITPEWDILKPRVYINGLLSAFPRYNIRKTNFLINGCPFKKWLWESVGGVEERTYEDWHVWGKIIIKHDPQIVYQRNAMYHYLQSDRGLNHQTTTEDIVAVQQDLANYWIEINA